MKQVIGHPAQRGTFVKWLIPLSHDTYQSVELQVPERKDFYEAM